MSQFALRDSIAEGQPSLGLMVFEFFTPGLPQLLHAAGVEFVVLDMEASALDLGRLSTLVLSSRSCDMTVLARIPEASRGYVTRVLDIGAQGVMVPNIEDALTAAEMVSAARYPPEGSRSAAFNIAHDFYGKYPPQESMAMGNETIIILQIESRTGVANANEIARVRGVDVLWIGHNDLANSLGRPGDFTHPDYQEAVAEVRRACTDHGVRLGGVASDATAARRMIRDGFTLVSLGSDITMLQTALRESLRQVDHYSS